MALKELAQSLGKRPSIDKHPEGRDFQFKWPIIHRNMEGQLHGIKEEALASKLTEIIRGRGDTQRHKTNVKAQMTDWFMQKQHKEFQQVGDIAIRIANDNAPHEIEMELYDCWGAIYHRNDWTKVHDHWPHPWSFVYYIKAGKLDSPLEFPDGYQGVHQVHPVSGDIVLFPGFLRHQVKPNLNDDERIIVAGNISPVLFPLAHPFRRFDQTLDAYYRNMDAT